MKNVTVDPGKALGPVKDMNCVGGGPVTNHFVYDATPDFMEAGIPLCRTHDIEYPFGTGEYVDIHCIFKDFDKDENDPAGYNFTFTDEYLKAIAGAGAQTFYRLGSTIEHQPIKLYIHPPKDFEKWGRICSHIIAHYNDGWADGFHMGIEYWEIWNEADIPMCWTGTPEQFVELYAAAAPIIKREHPDVKVGGCAFAHPDGPLAELWLKTVKERSLPMDFYSWHIYLHEPRRMREYAEKVDALLAKYGFADTESICDEWNYVVSWTRDLYRCYELHRTSFECAFMAAVMGVSQDTRINKSMFYDVQLCFEGSWNGVFGPSKEESHAATRRPVRRPGYYALKSWNELKKLGTQVSAVSDCPELYVTAAKGADGRLALMVSYYSDPDGWNRTPPPDETFAFTVPGAASLTAYVTDDENIFAPVPMPDGMLRMKGNSCALIVADE